MKSIVRSFGAFCFLTITTFFAGSVNATVQPFLPPAPVEGESRAYFELIESLSISNNPERLLRALNLARERTVGPTLLRAYIDCMRVGPLSATGDTDEAMAASKKCISSFPDKALPRLMHGTISVYNYDKPELLISGTDELISVFSDYPDLYKMVPFQELASPLRGLAAAGEKERKAALVKAYFSPIYVPSPHPASNNALLAGIAELLDSGEVALASRLAVFLQREKDVLGLLAFNPAKPIWPVLEARHDQGYDATRKGWITLEKRTPAFNSDRIALLSELGSFDQMESGSKTAIDEWDGKDDDAPVIGIIMTASGRLWEAGLKERSIALSEALINKADKSASGQIANVAFNAGYRMIQIGREDEGRALLSRFITEIEGDPSQVEWQSGNAYLNALRVCTLTGESAVSALDALEQASGDLYTQKIVAYECQKDKDALAFLMGDRLKNGPMIDRFRLAINLAPTAKNPMNAVSSNVRAAMEIEPLKSTLEELLRSDLDGHE